MRRAQPQHEVFQIDERRQSALHPDKIAARLPEWRRRYRQMLGTVNVLAPCPADYLFCGHRERFWRTARIARATFVQVVFHQGDATVYRVVGPDAEGAREFAGCG